jgi:hypothetical protein
MSLSATEAPPDEAYFGWEADESDEMMEAPRPRPRPGPVPVARPPTYPQQPPGGGQQGQYVTRVELQAELARVGAQITTNSTAIRRVDTRTQTVADSQRRQVTTQRRENAAIRRDVRETRELAAILPLLTPRPQSVALTEPVAGLAQGERVVVDRGTDTLTTLLPLLLLGGFGGTATGTSDTGGGSAGGGGGLDSSPLLLIALLTSQQRR